MTPSGLLAGMQGSGAADGDGSLPVPPPPNFRPALGVKLAYFGTAPVADSPPVGIAQKAGVRYEKHVHDYLLATWPPDVKINPWIEFYDGSGKRWCRPVALWIQPQRVVVVEVKIQHMPEAYWQLRRLYQPVVQKMFPEKRLTLLEIVKSYDPAMPFPEAHLLMKTIKEVKHIPDDVIGVLPWKD